MDVALTLDLRPLTVIVVVGFFSTFLNHSVSGSLYREKVDLFAFLNEPHRAGGFATGLSTDDGQLDLISAV